MRYRHLYILLAIALLWTAGPSCGPSGGDFAVQAFLQDGRSGVKLNEPLVLRFNRPVDPTTVTASAVLVADEDGKPARGDWTVSGAEARFQPDHPRDGDGGGAGLLFDRTYTLVVAGFPFHGSIHSAAGDPVSERTAFRFETVRRSAVEDGLAAFHDASPSEGPRLVSVNGIACGAVPPTGVELSPEAVIVLEFSEPLHPSGILAGGARIHVVDEGGESAGSGRTIPVECTLMEGPGNRKVLVRPEHPLMKGTRFNLRRESLGFTDFAGNAIQDTDFNFIQFICRDST